MDLVDLVIAARNEIPRTEFDIRRQIFRASTSIPSNVAEGYRRKKKRAAYQNHVSIALGSQGELDTQIEICARNSFMTRDTAQKLLALNDRVGAMLFRLHDSLD
jgi:four helix bundle protein